MHAFRFNDSRTSRRIDVIPPQHQPRTMAKASAARPADVVDVDFEIVAAGSRRSVYPVFNDNRRKPASGRSDRVASRSAIAATILKVSVTGLERFLQRASLRVFVALVGSICLSVFLVLGGFTDGAASMPAAADAPLSVTGISTAISEANGMKVISVYGTVENRSAAAKTIPPIRVDVIANGKRVTGSRIFSGEAVLAPGGNRPFATRFAHAGGKSPEVQVSFGETGASSP